MSDFMEEKTYHAPSELPHYEAVEIRESGEPLADLSKFGFILEPYYFQQGVSPTSTMLLRQGVVDRLLAAQAKLKGYKFKIYDGYRPRSVQRTVYQKFFDELQQKHPDWTEEQLDAEAGMYVTYPREPHRIPHHSTGGAVDLTLVDESSGRELDMGTGFDHFGPEAWQHYFEQNSINEGARKNQEMLRNALLGEDFNPFPYEWWHFDYGDQLWAASRQKPFAIYGEIPEPDNYK
jgi:D-alanyl-D-alanine dipeptidase